MVSQKKLVQEMLLVIEQRGINQKIVTEESGITESTLSRLKLSNRKADLETLVALSKWLGHKTVSEGAIVCDGNTLPNIKNAILRDKNLTEANKHKVWAIFKTSFWIWNDVQVRY